MTLHIFNPDHDLALAADLVPYTAPHAGRQLRADLSWLPALWSTDGDMVLVDNVDNAHEYTRHLRKYVSKARFVTLAELAQINVSEIEHISVWGWNRALCHQLKSCNKELTVLMPKAGQLSFIRMVSNRKWAAENLLPKLSSLHRRLVGSAVYTSEIPFDEEGFLMEKYGMGEGCVMKAPWSSSGRGVRYVERKLTTAQQNWVRNLIDNQGGIMIEPYYNKIEDFGMEFSIGEGGKTKYCGLSLFATQNGAYNGSILATEEAKRRRLARYVSEKLLDVVRDAIIDRTSKLLKGKYFGAFGVDMMIVRHDGVMKIHPCVELNLRRTMGHVALALTPTNGEPQQMMRINYDGSHYHLRIFTTGEDLLDTTIIRG